MVPNFGPNFIPNFVPKVYFCQFEIMAGKETYPKVKKVVINKIENAFGFTFGTIPKNVPNFVPKIVPKLFWDDFWDFRCNGP